MHADAQTDNALKGKSRIDTLTSTFLAATLSKAHTLQMKLLPAAGAASGSSLTAETLLAHGVGTTHKTVGAEGQRGLNGLPLTVEKLNLAVALRTIP